MKTHERYVAAILSNPEWIKYWVEAHAKAHQTFGAPELARQVMNLHNHLSDLLDVDEDAGEAT